MWWFAFQYSLLVIKYGRSFIFVIEFISIVIFFKHEDTKSLRHKEYIYCMLFHHQVVKAKSGKCFQPFEPIELIEPFEHIL
jgi:hypothetical protein